MILWASFAFFFVLFSFFSPYMGYSEDDLTIKRCKERIIYEIKADKERGGRKECEKPWEMLKELGVIIDRRDPHGKGKTNNR